DGVEAAQVGKGVPVHVAPLWSPGRARSTFLTRTPSRARSVPPIFPPARRALCVSNADGHRPQTLHEPPVLVRRGDETQQGARSRGGRLPLPRPAADRGLPQALGRNEQEAEGYGVPVGDVHAHVVRETRPAETRGAAEARTRAGGGGAAEAIRVRAGVTLFESLVRADATTAARMGLQPH